MRNRTDLVGEASPPDVGLPPSPAPPSSRPSAAFAAAEALARAPTRLAALLDLAPSSLRTVPLPMAARSDGILVSTRSLLARSSLRNMRGPFADLPSLVSTGASELSPRFTSFMRLRRTGSFSWKSSPWMLDAALSRSDLCFNCSFTATNLKAGSTHKIVNSEPHVRALNSASATTTHEKLPRSLSHSMLLCTSSSHPSSRSSSPPNRKPTIGCTASLSHVLSPANSLSITDANSMESWCSVRSLAARSSVTAGVWMDDKSSSPLPEPPSVVPSPTSFAPCAARSRGSNSFGTVTASGFESMVTPPNVEPAFSPQYRMRNRIARSGAVRAARGGRSDVEKSNVTRPLSGSRATKPLVMWAGRPSTVWSAQYHNQ